MTDSIILEMSIGSSGGPGLKILVGQKKLGTIEEEQFILII
jgi:hypothetical protein